VNTSRRNRFHDACGDVSYCVNIY